METLKLIIIAILIALVPTLSAQAQVDSATKTLQKFGLAFDYPAGWVLADKGTSDSPAIAIKSADSGFKSLSA